MLWELVCVCVCVCVFARVRVCVGEGRGGVYVYKEKTRSKRPIISLRFFCHCPLCHTQCTKDYLPANSPSRSG